MDPALPREIYATFAGVIDAHSAQRVFQAFPVAVNGSVKKVHFLIQSSGGSVAEGIAIHNYLKSLPLELITYNCGAVSSIAVLMYLSGKLRRATANSTFMIHKTTFTFQGAATAMMMRLRADCAELDDRNTDAILKDHIKMPEEKWRSRDLADLTIGADEALKFALVHEIADFAPPAGCQLYNI